MASAVLARTTTTTSGASFMGKIPFASPNPNPKFSHKRQSKHVAAGEIIIDESPAVTQTASDDASSINHHRRHNNKTTVTATASRCITFNVGSYSKKQLKELRKRFSIELEQIRQLKNRIDSFQAIPNNPQPPSSNKKSLKKLSGNKRPLPSNSSKDLMNLKRSHSDDTNLMKKCGQILTKLMKHKHGWIFNTPVDVDRMGLHDYYDIIKNPMDLGTVKSRISKGFYPSPVDFADDVRLTFGNALKYNPKGHDVYAMAEQLLDRFEELFRPIGEMLEFRPSNQQQQQQQQQDRVFDEDEELQASSWNDLEESFVPVAKKLSSENEDRLLHRGRAPTNPNPMPTVQSPVRTPSPMKVPPVKPLKQPKPKAKDPNKREMSMEEKHKLGNGLQSLPPEKMEQVVQIIRKRNGNLKQDGDEIELDIEAVDTETLWELDRLVTNWKKMVSKIKRQALMGNNMNNNGELAMSERSERIDVVASEVKTPKKGEAGEEDVDIGDEMPMGNFPPVEIEKDVGGGHATSSSSSSSSSDSDSSSSSDSDSGSSSGSDSDADNAQS